MAKAMGLNTVCAYLFWNSHEGWTIAYVDSEERAKEDGTAENAIDGQTANFWHTEWSDKKPGHPHRLILDLGQSREVGGLRYIPRQGQGGGASRITACSSAMVW